LELFRITRTRKGSLMSSLLNEAKEMAKRWIDEQTSLFDLLTTLPEHVFEDDLVGLKAPSSSTKLAKKSAKKIAKKSSKSVSKVKPVKKNKGGRVRKTVGDLTPEKREEIMSRLGNLPAGTPEYNTLRDTICRDLSLSRRQVSNTLNGIRMFKAGKSNIHKAWAATKKK